MSDVSQTFRTNENIQMSYATLVGLCESRTAKGQKPVVSCDSERETPGLGNWKDFGKFDAGRHLESTGRVVKAMSEVAEENGKRSWTEASEGGAEDPQAPAQKVMKVEEPTTTGVETSKMEAPVETSNAETPASMGITEAPPEDQENADTRETPENAPAESEAVDSEVSTSTMKVESSVTASTLDVESSEIASTVKIESSETTSTVKVESSETASTVKVESLGTEVPQESEGKQSSDLGFVIDSQGDTREPPTAPEPPAGQGEPAVTSAIQSTGTDVSASGEAVVEPVSNPSTIPTQPVAPAQLPSGPSAPATLPDGLPPLTEAPLATPPSVHSQPLPIQQPPQVPSPAPAPIAAPTVAETKDPNEAVEEKGEISIAVAGRVIGKGGEIIRDLQARSGAQIDVDQSADPGQPRIITYRGHRSKVDFAKKLVQMISDGVADSDLPIGQARREILIIPASATGKVIGRGGEMVREMQNRSHAKIDFDHSPSHGVGPDQKRVVVTGTDIAVTKAKEMILFLVSNPLMEAMQSLNILVDDKLRGGGQWGSGPPYLNLPSQGANMRPEMFHDGAGGGYQQGGAPGGANYHQHHPPSGYNQPPPGGMHYGASPQQHQPPYQQGGRYPGGPGGPGGSANDIMYAKKQFMGRIIGQKGVTINDLQRRSSTDIQINQDVPPGQDCEIRIRGSPEGVEMAKQMIQQIIEIGPNHPFAGGAATSYSGGPGGYGGSYGGGYQQPPPQSYGYGQPYMPYQQPYGHAPYDPYAAQGYASSYSQSSSGASSYGGAPYGAQQSSYHSMGGYGASGGPPQPGYGASASQPQQQSHQYGGHMQQQQAPKPQQSYGGGGGYHPPAPAPAPTEWKSTTTPEGQTYYYNERTGATQWDKPAGMP